MAVHSKTESKVIPNLQTPENRSVSLPPVKKANPQLRVMDSLEQQKLNPFIYQAPAKLFNFEIIAFD
jgi:hypothetical protein